MKREDIIHSLLDQARDKDLLADGDETSIFIEDAKALREAVALLKAQEPRVITAEQLEDWLEPVYLEDIFSGARWALIADFSANWFTFKVTEPGFLKEEEFHATEYGRRWRCWNKKPTKEQREAVEWE